MFPSSGLFRWHRRNDDQFDYTPTPVIVDNRQSEAIERLLRRLDTCICKLSSLSILRPLSELQLQRRTVKIFFLESCRHFLISIQFLLAFLLQPFGSGIVLRDSVISPTRPDVTLNVFQFFFHMLQ